MDHTTIDVNPSVGDGKGRDSGTVDGERKDAITIDGEGEDAGAVDGEGGEARVVDGGGRKAGKTLPIVVAKGNIVFNLFLAIYVRME